MAFKLFANSSVLVREEPLLSQEQLALLQRYQMNEEYLAAFPLDLYVLRTMPTRGVFYDDQIYDGLKIFLREERLAWEPENNLAMMKYIVPNTMALDIGAHIGLHTVTMSKAVQGGTVIAFEPQKKVCRELAMNLLENGCHNVAILQCALGDENKTAYMGKPVYGNEGARFISNQDFDEAVEMRTSDSFGLEHISFIKIDSENFEQEILRGAEETLRKNRPVLLVEIQGNQIKAQEDGVDMGLKTQESIEFLESMGYDVKRYACFDYLAIPKKRLDP